MSDCTVGSQVGVRRMRQAIGLRQLRHKSHGYTDCIAVAADSRLHKPTGHTWEERSLRAAVCNLSGLQGVERRICLLQDGRAARSSWIARRNVVDCTQTEIAVSVDAVATGIVGSL